MQLLLCASVCVCLLCFGWCLLFFACVCWCFAAHLVYACPFVCMLCFVRLSVLQLGCNMLHDGMTAL